MAVKPKEHLLNHIVAPVGLAQNLAQNKPGNLSANQIEAVRIIHSSGTDLLNLINEILDLSKIEAGRMDIDLYNEPIGTDKNGEAVYLRKPMLAVPIEHQFEQVLEQLKAEYDQVIIDATPLLPVADGFELNMSCPHAKGYGVEVGQDTRRPSRIGWGRNRRACNYHTVVVVDGKRLF